MLIENISNILTAYETQLKDNYTNTGSDFSKLTLEDIDICKSILESNVK